MNRLSSRYAVTAWTTVCVVMLALSSMCRADQLHDLQAVNTEISDVLNALAIQSGKNIVVSSDVKGTITVQLKQVTFENALDYVVKMQGFAWRQEGSAYLVSKPETLKSAFPDPVTPPVEKPDPVVTELYSANYLSLDKLKETLGLVITGLTITPAPDTITPVLGTGSDRPYPGGGTSDDGGSSAKTQRTSASQTLIIKGPKTSVQEALDLCRRLDTPRPQARVEAMILDVSENGLKELGIQWSWGELGLTEATPTPGVMQFGKFSRSGASIEATISALMTNGSARLLAKPNLSVIDAESASILIGDRLLYPILIGYTQLGTPIYDKEEEKVGIYLQVAPRIGADGYITLGIYPQVSTVTKYLETDVGSYPQISTRETQTTVRVKSGESIAIGGLFKEEEIRTMSGIPLLSDLPILGELFKYRKSNKTKSEIVIIITPQILSESSTEAGK